MKHTHADGTTHDHGNSVENHAHYVIGRDDAGNQLAAWRLEPDDPEAQPPNGTGPVVSDAG